MIKFLITIKFQSHMLCQSFNITLYQELSHATKMNLRCQRNTVSTGLE